MSNTNVEKGFSVNQCLYADWARSTHVWCEEQLCSWIREPANTFSNATYVIVGIVILLNARKHAYPHLRLLGWFAILLGFMSGFYHATSSFVGEVLDYSSMFLISSYLVVANLSRLYLWAPRRVMIAATLLFTVSVIGLVQLRTVGAVFFGIQIWTALIVELVLRKRSERRPEYKSLWTSCGLFAVAWGIWNLDTHRIVCDPTNHFINGHALWHVLTGIAIWFIFKFYTQFGLRHESK